MNGAQLRPVLYSRGLFNKRTVIGAYRTREVTPEPSQEEDIVSFTETPSSSGVITPLSIK